MSVEMKTLTIGSTTYEIVDEKARNSINEKITIPETASVGQTIKVKTVDENGKPTEWEAVDSSSSGSGGIETVYICAGVNFTNGGAVSHSDNLSAVGNNYVTFAEAEELYQKWMSGAVNIIAVVKSSLESGGGNTYGKVIGMVKSAADSSGSTYDIGFSVSTSSGLHTAYVAHDQT